MKESEDMSVIGPVIKEQQKILNECTEKKISLVKIQTNLIQKGASDSNKFSPGKLTLSDEDREKVYNILKDKGYDVRNYFNNFERLVVYLND